MMRVGITGGIGAGKSTVCRLFAELGVAVYDSDAAAKRLMHDDPELRRRIAERFGEASYRGGVLDRAFLAGAVFGDAEALAALEGIVHPAVRRDFEAWTARQKGDYVVFECAILFEAGMERAVDRTVAVLAPAQLRIERAMRRDGADAEAIRRRIAAQADDDTLRDRADYVIVNILEEDLRTAVAELDRIFRHEAQHRPG